VARGLGVAVPCEDHAACSLDRRTALELDALLCGNSRPIAGLLERVWLSVGGPLPTFVEFSSSLVLAIDVPACHGWRAPSHSMSPGAGYARPSSFTSVGECPPSMARHRPGFRPSNTNSVACRGRRVPLTVSKGGASGRKADGGGHGGQGHPPSSACSVMARKPKNGAVEWRQRAECGRARGEQVGAIDCVAMPDELPAELGPSPHLTALSPMTPRQIARCRPSADLSRQRHGLRTGTA
jgi:hypothetical protein